MSASAWQAVKAARERLMAARLGFSNMKDDPNLFWTGLCNVAVFGRMVTFSLQNMKHTTNGFDEWYNEKQKEFYNDPVIQLFNKLRVGVEKQAMGSREAVTVIAHVVSFGTSDLHKYSRPPGATRFVIGSTHHGGASGWLVPTEDGDKLFAVSPIVFKQQRDF